MRMNSQSTDNPEELFIIIDENDTILGYKTREECHNDPSLLHRSIHIAILNDKGEVLLQKRSKNKDLNPGWYCISVGGHVEKGETDEQTAHREIVEELGIDNVDLEFVTTFLAWNTPDSERVALFKTNYNGDFNYNKDEIEDVAFFTREEVEKIKDTITEKARKSLEILGFL